VVSHFVVVVGLCAPMTQKADQTCASRFATRYQCFCAGFGFTADYSFTAVYLRLHSRPQLYSRFL